MLMCHQRLEGKLRYDHKMHVTPGLQEYKLCTAQKQKQNKKNHRLELRYDFILFTEVYRHLE